MSKERILITVKTYPTLSRKYGGTVYGWRPRGWHVGTHLPGSVPPSRRGRAVQEV